MRGYRNVPHAQQDTTGACEGWHSSIKGGGLAEKRRLIGRRTDWLLHKLFYEVGLSADYVQAAAHQQVHHMYSSIFHRLGGVEITPFNCLHA